MSAVMSLGESEDSESSMELVFPAKVEIGASFKPALPKLDFSKLNKKIPIEIKKIEPKIMQSLEKQIEDLCKQRTDQIKATREKIC